LPFDPGELKHEVGWKPIGVSLDLLVESPSRDAVKAGQIGVQNHIPSADINDQRFDGFGHVLYTDQANPARFMEAALCLVIPWRYDFSLFTRVRDGNTFYALGKSSLDGCA
jgi:hypothetical protein